MFVFFGFHFSSISVDFGPPFRNQNGNFSQCLPRRMDTWPSNTAVQQSEKNCKGKVKATFLPCPLLEGGALTSSTLREDEQGRFEWVTAQNRASGTCERCSILILLISLV
jgi:hypothetical protein